MKEIFLDVVRMLALTYPVKEISERTGYQKSMVSRLLNGKLEPSVPFLKKFCEVFNLDYRGLFVERQPISANAAYIGELSGGVVELSKSGNEFIDLGNGQFLMIVPLVEPYAQAGYTSGYSDERFIEELPKHTIIVNQRHKGLYRAFRVMGDSMDDDSKKSICDGDIVTGRSIEKHHWTSRFHLHKFTDYIIVHKEGVIIKTITEHDVEEGIIYCQSRNQDKSKYRDYELNLSEVNQIFNVVDVTRSW